MTVTTCSYPNAPMEVDGKGISFEPEFDGFGVTICVEVRDGRDYRDHYVTLSREDWLAVVAYMEGGTA